LNGHVSVVIVNWNGQRYLESCLSSALNQTYPDYEVVLVDNASSDGSVEFVRTRFPQVRLIALDENGGFAAGNHIGIRASEGDFVATLNNDTEVAPGWLKALVQGMSAAPKVGMVASKMCFFDRREVINSTGIALDRAGIAWDRDGGALDAEAGTTPGEVFGPCAGAALYRRRMLDEIGGFDDDFFYLYEDVDLAWRGQLAGWRGWYCPDARVYHVHAGAGTEGTPFKRFLLGRNRIWAMIKCYPSPHWIPRLPLLLAHDLLASAYSLIRHGDLHALRGRLAGYASLRRLLPARARVQALRRASWADLASRMEPIRAPWAVLNRFKHLR
jgi:GT2 family glycosyltransferase